MFPELLWVLAFMAAFVLHCSVVGGALLPRALQRPASEWNGNGYLKWFFALSLGMLANIAMLFVLGMAGFLSKPAVLATAALTLAAAAPICVRTLRFGTRPVGDHAASGRSESFRPHHQAATLAAVALLFFLSVVVAFHPPGHWDDTMYQLPLSRFYLQQEAIALNEYLRFPLFPQNMNLLFTLGLMFGGDILAQAFSSLPIFVMGVGLIAVSLLLLGTPHVGILAAALLFMIGPIKRTLGYAYIDNGLGMFCWAAIVAVLMWGKEDQAKRSWHWVVLAGLMAGGAAGTKYFGVVLAAILGGYLLLARRSWRAALIYGAAVLAAGAWWYVRSAVISGDPVHPAGGGIFGHFLWDAQDLVLQKQEQATHGTSRNPLLLWTALKDAHVPLWALALLSLFLNKVPKAIRVLQGIFLAYFAFWFFVTQVWRYLAPIYAVATFLSCYTINRGLVWLPKPTALRTPRASSVAALALAALLGVYAVDRVRSYADDMAKWESILAADPGYRLFTAANKHIPAYGPTLVQLGFENNIYFFNGTVIGDWFGPGRYRDMMECSPQGCRPLSSGAMRRYLQDAGSRMLAVSTGTYPGFDAAEYAEDFIVLSDEPGGVLLGLRPS